MHQTNSLFILSILLIGGSILYLQTHPKDETSGFDLEQLGTPGKCLSYLPYDTWKDPQVDYYNWYGLQGKDIRGKTYLTGHAFQRHVAVNGACTLEQKQQNKTVFYNLAEFQKAASKIPSLCDIGNRTTFTYDYDGKFAAPSDYISGIDCRSGQRQQFPAYFIEFKRAIRNGHPAQADYLNSNYVTFWTFYPKRA